MTNAVTVYASKSAQVFGRPQSSDSVEYQCYDPKRGLENLIARQIESKSAALPRELLSVSTASFKSNGRHAPATTSHKTRKPIGLQSANASANASGINAQDLTSSASTRPRHLHLILYKRLFLSLFTALD